MKKPDHLAELLQAVAMANTAILDIYQQDNAVATTSKTDGSPLTQADLAANEILTTAVSTYFSSDLIVSEEGDLDLHHQRTECSRYWLIDPLDGTKEFINKNGEFTVNIALIENNYPKMGIVGIPATHKILWGGKSYGSFILETDTLRPNDLGQSKSIRVTGDPIDGQWLNLTSRSHATAGEQQGLPELELWLTQNIGSPATMTTKAMGSSLKFTEIAKGNAHFYARQGPTCEWDTAAAQAVVEGAGGRVVSLDTHRRLDYGRVSDYTNKNFFVSSLAQDLPTQIIFD